MPELIDKNALICKVCNECQHCNRIDEMGGEPTMCKTVMMIAEMPTIEPEMRHGRWVHHNGGYSDHFECTACGKDIVLTGKWRFCPNCGADMRDGGAENG